MLGNDFELILQHQPMVKSEKPIVGSIVEVWVWGFFSQRRFVTHKGNGRHYALKTLKKAAIIKMKQAKWEDEGVFRDQKAKLTVAKGHR